MGRRNDTAMACPLCGHLLPADDPAKNRLLHHVYVHHTGSEPSFVAKWLGTDYDGYQAFEKYWNSEPVEFHVNEWLMGVRDGGRT